MFRVFLAEDDGDVRKAIREGIDWAEEGFELVGEAADGGLALPMSLDLRADILIASRRMPFMDGMDLFCALRASLPWAQLILLSGYDGLPEAQQEGALKEMEYLLKPVNIYELTDALRRAARRLNDMRRTLYEAARRQGQAAMDARRANEAALRRWLEARSDADWPEGMRCRLLRILSCEPVGREGMEEFYALMERGVASIQGVCAVGLPDGRPGLLIMAREDDALEAQAYCFASAILANGEQLLDVRLHVHISRVAWDLPSLREAWRSLEATALDGHRPILGEGDAMRLHPGVRPPMNPMGEWLLSAGEEELDEALSRCARVGLLSPARVAAAAAQLEEEALGGCMGMWTPQKTQDAMRAQLVRAIRLARSRAPWLARSPLSHARKYLSVHFRNPGLQLYNVARDSGMTMERFRVVFAQEMGMTFTEYMRRMRISGARILLTDTRMRISGIARAVGYSEPEVFSEAFQKMVGMDPKEYRNACAPRT